MQTLREQIREIHSRHFNKEFHEYRQDLIPAMVNDLKMKFFDDLCETFDENYTEKTWCLDDSVDIRAVKRASVLISTLGLRENTPAVV